MARESVVVECLADMADTLVSDFDIVDVLTDLADRCVSLLGISAAGVMLVSAQGELRLVASSSEAMRVLELYELQAQEGPCYDALLSGERVEHADLRAGRSHWPRFAPAALEAGFNSVDALPLKIRTETVGALNLFSVLPRPIDEASLVVARAFADLAAIGVLAHRSADAQRLNEQLSEALSSRMVVEQAKGIIAAQLEIDISDTFLRLRDHARDKRLLLTDAARAIMDGTLDLQA